MKGSESCIQLRMILLENNNNNNKKLKQKNKQLLYFIHMLLKLLILAVCWMCLIHCLNIIVALFTIESLWLSVRLRLFLCPTLMTWRKTSINNKNNVKLGNIQDVLSLFNSKYSIQPSNSRVSLYIKQAEYRFRFCWVGVQWSNWNHRVNW